MADNNTPTIQNYPVLDFPIPIPSDPTNAVLPMQQRLDAKSMHYTFCRMAEAWSEARGVDAICKMALLTVRMLEKNRDFLGLPRAHKDTEKKEYYVLPID
jgi:hypothetical protein